ncbi:hypothetical protein DFH11DRAFT_1730243 [Phellopilus nigrolimitatus]|nr:hypothetical protein DFH11DRAFT_1730243 [Phellopilus nigrolimitatus]
MSGFPGGIFAKRLRRTQTQSTVTPGWNTHAAGPSSEQPVVNPRFGNTGRTDAHNIFGAAPPSAPTTHDEYLVAGPSTTTISAARVAEDDASDASTITIKASPQRAQTRTPTQFSVFKDTNVDDEIDERNAGRYWAESSFDLRDYRVDEVDEMPVSRERYHNAMEAQRTAAHFDNERTVTVTATPSSSSVYLEEAGGAVAGRVSAQGNTSEGNGTPSVSEYVEHRAASVRALADRDAQPTEGSVFGESVSEGRKRNSASNVDEEVPRAKGTNAKRAKASSTTPVAPQAAEPVDTTTEDAGPRTQARTKATQPEEQTVCATAATPPTVPTAPVNSAGARVPTRVQPARAARAKAVPVTKAKTTARKAKGKARASAPSPEPISVAARAKRRRALATIKREESVALLHTPRKTRQKVRAPAVLPSAPAPPAKPVRKARQKAPVAPSAPAPAPPAKPVRKMRQKAEQAPVVPPPAPAPPAEPADPSKTRTLRSKRAYGLEVPKPKPRTRRTAQQTAAPASEEAGKPKRKSTAGQKRRRDDDDADDNGSDDAEPPANAVVKTSNMTAEQLAPFNAVNAAPPAARPLRRHETTLVDGVVFTQD